MYALHEFCISFNAGGFVLGFECVSSSLMSVCCDSGVSVEKVDHGPTFCTLQCAGG